MLTYSQTSGEWKRDDILLFAGCYAGMASSKNNPAAQGIRNAGPLPQGIYGIGHLQHFAHLGPAMPLTPLTGKTEDSSSQTRS